MRVYDQAINPMCAGVTMGASYAGPADRLAMYERLVATAKVELKGATMPYTSRDGHMFSFLDPSGTMALRLPTDARGTFLERTKRPSPSSTAER